MTLITVIKTKKVSEIRQIVKETPIADIAEQVTRLSTQQRGFFFRTLNSSDSGKLFSFLEPSIQKQIIKGFTDRQQKKMLASIYADDIADLIEEMPSNIAKQILQNTTPDRRKEINTLLRYNEEQTGSIMSIDMIEILQSLTTAQAVRLIKIKYKHLESTSNYFVVNQKGKLVGMIKLQELVFADDEQQVKDIMSPVASVFTTTNKEAASLEFAKHDISVLPVTNKKGYLVGMITSDDIIDTINEEATEDIHKMAGVANVKESYLKTTIFKLFKSRVFWLLLLMISSTLSQIVLDSFMRIFDNLFNPTTQAVTATLTTILVAIVPVISGAAGNAGSQASTMVTRSIALGELGKGKFFLVLKKEIFTSIMVGGVLAIVNFIRLIIYYLITGDLWESLMLSSDSYPFIWIAFSSSLSLFVVIIFAKIVGGLLPMLACRLKLDPAAMAAPLLTTFIDALSILTFFCISFGILLLTVIN